mmetsp:Transcript_8924/g.14835  ORF Transcript_8924/g.14835 Transcript_8924/m.14835 type:complete len:192 (+) Transcript_8924:147-722(+)|eukprot:CAMPEP_0174973040 /NCGR_PEP_ID=MMETSP0004_2-20121128/10998_1 /TAXON_ID=420556 /ORGANISM="Ochromonas sp., Strain CCMP1393" /LENGTH=191 /DNA_ID=CAMNT_0016223399 /DNA_START=144 /DNA_END=719 /DNA_ORIENTATION=-
MNASEDDAPFLRILESMGIDKYDPLVPTALNEYATRLASELLKDARDYAAHAGRSDIEADDIKLAVKLSDSHCAGIDANENVQMHIQRQLQMKGLTQLADPESVLHRYPQDMLMQRTFTFIPGAEAYTKDDEVQLDNETQQDKAISVRGGDVQVRQQDTGTASQQQGLIRFQTGSRIGNKKLNAAPGFNDI